jgi:DNA replication licensing factor MCM7
VRIKDFLSKFVGPASGDVTDGMADMDIGDQDIDAEAQRTRGLKYMSQLVRVNHSYLFQPVLAQAQQRIANRDQQMLVIDLEDIVKVCL